MTLNASHAGLVREAFGIDPAKFKRSLGRLAE